MIARDIQTLMLKPPIEVLKWVNYTSKLSPDAQKAKNVLTRTSTILGWMATPQKFEKLKKSLNVLGKDLSLRHSASTFKASMSLVAVGTGAVKLAQTEGLINRIDWQTNFLGVIGIVACASTVFKNLFDIERGVKNLFRFQFSSFQFSDALLDLMHKIGKIILASLTIALFFLGTSLNLKLAILIFSSITLSLSISKYFFNLIPSK